MDEKLSNFVSIRSTHAGLNIDGFFFFARSNYRCPLDTCLYELLFFVRFVFSAMYFEVDSKFSVRGVINNLDARFELESSRTERRMCYNFV